MPREKKQRLKKRKDGRFACRYKDQWFYSFISDDDALAQREEYKRLERLEIASIPSVKDYATRWLDRAYPSVTASTKAGLRIHLRKLTDAVGDLPLDSVKPSQIKDVYSTRYLGLSKSYIDGARQLYCGLFDAAVADGYIRINPAREKPAKPHKGTVGGHRAITPDERRWIDTLCTDHRAWPAVMVMLYAGLRPQEMKALVIDRDVDFKNETITVRETAHLDGQRYEFSDEMKTDFSHRTIPLLPTLKAALEGKKGNLITSAHGEPVTIDTWRVAWESYVSAMETAINGLQRRWYGRTREHRAIIESGGNLPPWVPFTVVPYDLRHSFCCMCRDNGVELNTCIRWMGHADAKMILKIYDEVSSDRSEKEAEKLKKTLIRSQIGSQQKSEHSENGEK